MAPVLCLITDRHRWGDRWRDALVEHVRRAAGEEVALVQVREPDLDGADLAMLVERCLKAVRGTRTRVIVNDRLDVALAVGAHGVHLRANSVPPARVRSLCPRPLLLGRSIHSLHEAKDADPSVLDYLIFGTVFPSSSKRGRDAAGLDALRAACEATVLPVLAIGGVTYERIPDVMRNGAAGAAGISLFAGAAASASAK